jgi:hypothetical protein
VFVRWQPDTNPHHLLIDNDPRWQSSQTWVVRAWTDDRHRALLAAAPEREAYLFDAASGWFLRMSRDGTRAADRVLHVLDADQRLGRGIECG